VEVEVSSATEVLDLMKKAEEQRKVGETKMNKHSSRSHCIFSILVKAKSSLADGTGMMEFSGKLHMVDLAGSECAKTANLDKASGSEAARERERMNINRSLLTLGRVISMLKEQSESKKSRQSIRIPYRDSKLTRILQEALGGRCKTVIIATLSPSVTAIEESISTLNYAQSANGIVNKPIATSHLRLTPAKAMSNISSATESTGDDDHNIEHWYEMECRLQYMQAQVEEAQAALARKHVIQQEATDRAERLEEEKTDLEEKYANALEEIKNLEDKLTSEVAKKEEEIKIKEETMATLEQTENTLRNTEDTLAAEIQKKEETMAKLAETEATLKATEDTLAEEIRIKEETMAKLAETEAVLKKTQETLADEIRIKEETMAKLAETETVLKKTQETLAEEIRIKEETMAKLAETEAVLKKTQETLEEEIKKKEDAISKLKKTEVMVKKTAVILDETQQTETSLTDEASKLLATLKESIVDGDSLHSLVVLQRQLHVELKSATRNFHAASLNVLKETSATLDNLASMNNNYRSLVESSANDVHGQERKFIDEMSTLMKEIGRDVKNLTDTMKAQVVDDGGIVPTLDETSSCAKQGLDDIFAFVSRGDDELLSSCKAARQQLKESSDKLKDLSVTHTSKSAESLSTLESGINSSKEKIAAMVTSVTEALKAARDARFQARAAHNELLQRWKVSSLAASKCIENTSKDQSNIVDSTIAFFGTEMQNHDKMESALQDQTSYILKNGDAHIEHVSEQASMLLEQKESLAAAHERNQKMRENFMQTVMAGVQELMKKQMDLLRTEENEQFGVLQSSTDNLTNANGSIRQSAKDIFTEVENTNSMLSEHVQIVRKNDIHVTGIMEKTKETLDEIASSSVDHQESTSTFANDAADGISSMDNIDSEKTNVIIKHVESDGAQCSDHLKDIVLKQTRDNIENLTEAGDQIYSYGAHGIIPKSMSDIDTIENPRKEVMNGLDKRVKEVTAGISTGQDKIKVIAGKQCATADELYADAQAKEKVFEDDTSTRRKSQVDQNKEHILNGTADHANKTKSILSDGTTQTNDLKNKIVNFAMNDIKAEEEIVPAPVRLSLSYSEDFTSTPIDDAILRGHDFESNDEMILSNGHSKGSIFTDIKSLLLFNASQVL